MNLNVAYQRIFTPRGTIKPKFQEMMTTLNIKHGQIKPKTIEEFEEEGKSP